MVGKTRVLGSFDWMELNTSYSHQMRMMIDHSKDWLEWNAIALGKMNGKPVNAKTKKGVGYGEIPQAGDNTHVAANLYSTAEKIKPDCIFLYEDCQFLALSLRKMSKWPRICWFPWDNEEWGESVEVVMDLAEFPVVIAKNSQQIIQDYGYEVEQIYNLCDDDVFTPVTRKAAEKFKTEELGIPPEKKVLLYVGKAFPRKNIECLFGMAHELKRMRDDFILLMHMDPEDTSRSCDPLIEIFSRDIHDVIQFTPGNTWHTGVPKNYLNMVYNVADVFVSAHAGEGFGLPSCEAGLCGKPFVMTDYTTTAEFGGDGTHGLGVKIKTARMRNGIQRPMPDIGDFARKVDYLLDDPILRFEMGNKFRKWVVENCSPSVLMPKWRKIFEKTTCNEVTVK